MKFVYESYNHFITEMKGTEDKIKSIFNLKEIERNPDSVKKNIKDSFDDEAIIRDLKGLVDQFKNLKSEEQKEELIDFAVKIAKGE